MSRTTIDVSLLSQNAFGPANILDNGGFEVWQRGTSFTSTSGSPVYTADRWFSNGNAGQSIAITQESSIIDSGLYSLKVVTTNANSNAFNMVQTIENKQAYYGKTLSLSMRVKTTVANTVNIGFVIGNGVYAWSNFHSGSGNWETLTVTGTIASSLTVPLNIYVGATTVAIPNGSIYYADSAMLVMGNQPVSFVPMHPATELVRCQRYYEFGTLDMLHPVWSNSNTVLTCYYARDFRVGKAFAPTVTITKPTTVFLDNLSPNSTGGSNGSYTSDPGANWTASSGAVTTGSFQCTMSRASATPSVSNLMESGPTWVASADL